MDDKLYDTIHRAVEDVLAKHRKEFTNALLLLCVLWIGSLLLDYFSYAPWFNRFRYSVWYGADDSQVKQSQDRLPSDCDFLKAPIGRKGCHYKKHVEVQEPSAANGNKRTVFVYWSKEEGESD
jgi:hypothetical protein